MRLWVCLIATLALGLLAMACGPEEEGHIAFWSSQDGNGEIYLMDPDGSNMKNLTNHPANDQGPKWSPDGSKIAFYTDRDYLSADPKEHSTEIYVMNADGSNPTRITNSFTIDAWPSWSPDGSKIAFQSYRDGNENIYVMNADGTDPVRLTSHPKVDYYPAWSPDGSKIAFYSDRDDNLEIYIMNADGSNQTNLSREPLAFDESPSWSPDGTKIAFWSSRVPDYYDVYTMDPDGGNQTRITNNPGFDGFPSWSPDGAKIVFYSNRDGDRDGDRDGNTEIYTMNADGSNQKRLTNHPARDAWPAWSPAP